MVVWSSLAVRAGLLPQCRKLISIPKFNAPQSVNVIQIRSCKGTAGRFNIVNSSYTYNKLKDFLHFYLILTSIPVLCIIFYCNVFIGSATLQPIPEGYTPKPWEYHSHPISRFIARYIVRDPQKVYEKTLHCCYTMNEKSLMRSIERRVKILIRDRRDFQAWYYTPATTKYARENAQALKDRIFKDPFYE